MTGWQACWEAMSEIAFAFAGKPKTETVELTYST